VDALRAGVSHQREGREKKVKERLPGARVGAKCWRLRTSSTVEKEQVRNVLSDIRGEGAHWKDGNQVGKRSGRGGLEFR